jgi:hypothetical protein
MAIGFVALLLVGLWRKEFGQDGLYGLIADS